MVGPVNVGTAERQIIDILQQALHRFMPLENSFIDQVVIHNVNIDNFWVLHPYP